MTMLKALPAIDQALQLPELSALVETHSRELVVSWVREAIEEFRLELQAGAELELGKNGKLADSLIADRVLAISRRMTAPSLRRVVNATGIAIHTNLGRAPLPGELLEAVSELLGSYSNLEFDLESGERGSRHSHLERLIPAATGAEAGLVVNNNAAAVLVALNTLAAGREVVVSRGELIEIGGSFRMPEIIASGGARLCEVGTTNKTRLSDYEKAIGSDTALLLKVHPSNYKIQGFTEEAGLKELVALGRSAGLPVMLDLGSGLLYDLEARGIMGEKPVRWYMETGVEVLTFSGDKLLGGPQAGFIAGNLEIIERIKRNPMVRALRAGKLTISMLEAMLRIYLSPSTAAERIPALGLLLRAPEELRRRAGRLSRAVKKAWPEAAVRVEPDHAFAGGGSLPGVELPTFVVVIEVPGRSGEELARGLRRSSPPVVGRLRSGRFCLDLRTVLDDEPRLIVSALRSVRDG